MLAVIEVNGKQFLVKEGDRIKIDSPTVGEIKVLLLAEQRRLDADYTQTNAEKIQHESAPSPRKSALLDVKIGTPYLEDKKVEVKILGQGRGRKKIIFHYHSKTRHRKKAGHRQHYTEIQIEKIITQ